MFLRAAAHRRCLVHQLESDMAHNCNIAPASYMGPKRKTRSLNNCLYVLGAPHEEVYGAGGLNKRYEPWELEQTIESLYRLAIKKFHPDAHLNNKPLYEEKIKEIVQCYEDAMNILYWRTGGKYGKRKAPAQRKRYHGTGMQRTKVQIEEDRKKILELHLQGFSQAEISKRLDIPDNRISYDLKALRQQDLGQGCFNCREAGFMKGDWWCREKGQPIDKRDWCREWIEDTRQNLAKKRHQEQTLEELKKRQ